MDEVLYKSLLYDYYNSLLTDKQREVYEMYYLNDMSLGEISENTGVTAQGISDMLKRTHKSLLRYEEKLQLIENHKDIKAKLESALEILENMASDNNSEAIKYILSNLTEYI